ncbi:MAG: peptidoglycan DD-metalloendopeptidase family protein [Novosphingobium sp.]|nr:peptidoglycan DD-metalloendopeptidase family protein [Novosphingobium sp.]
MTSRQRLALPPILASVAFAAVAALGQAASTPQEIAETQRAMAEARKQGGIAKARAEKLEAEARRVSEQVEKTARQAAAVAARIQETEAEIAGHAARLQIISGQREELRAKLAEREQPLIRLTAGLARLSRRPPLLALLRPGSVRDTMHLRALLETMMPEVERRTAALRVEIEKGRQLERRSLAAAGELRKGEAELKNRRKQLAAIETRQRLASRKASGIASRESERALALAEKARDLGELVEQVGKQGELREQLAQLPGPIMRPPRPEESEVITATAFTPPPTGLPRYILPLAGSLVSGFGDEGNGGPRSRGIVLSARPGAQAVSPAPGRVAFAGPYRGYGRIIIIEHDGGWTTLVTGLAQLDADVGEELVAGSPLGLTGPGDPRVTVELRQNGAPVNPLQFLRPL